MTIGTWVYLWAFCTVRFVCICFCISTIPIYKQQKKREIKESIAFTTATKRTKYPGINLHGVGYHWATEKTRGGKRPVCRKLVRHWWKKSKTNAYTTQSNLQIQCYSYQSTNGIFHRTRTENFTICMETQKTPNSQSNLEKENDSWREIRLLTWYCTTKL